VKGELVQKYIGRETTGGIRIGWQGRDAGTVWEFDFHCPIFGIATAVIVFAGFDDGPQRLAMALDTFFDGLFGLAFTAGEDHPASATPFQIRQLRVTGQLKRSAEGFAGLACKHADFEAAFIRYPAALVG